VDGLVARKNHTEIIHNTTGVPGLSTEYDNNLHGIMFKVRIRFRIGYLCQNLDGDVSSWPGHSSLEQTGFSDEPTARRVLHLGEVLGFGYGLGRNCSAFRFCIDNESYRYLYLWRYNDNL
jgi:hypothetical protein